MAVFSSVTHSIQTGGVPLQNMPPDDELDASYKALRSVVTHPEFKNVLAEIKSLSPPNERLQAAFTKLTIPVLTARGIPTPAGLRITIRASQEDSTGPTTSTADAAAAWQNTAGRPLLQIGGTLWLGPWLHWDW